MKRLISITLIPKNHPLISVPFAIGTGILAWAWRSARDRDDLNGLLENIAVEAIGLFFGIAIVSGIIERLQTNRLREQQQEERKARSREEETRKIEREREATADAGLRNRLGVLRNFASNAMADFIGPPIVGEDPGGGMIATHDVQKKYDLFVRMLGTRDPQGLDSDWRHEQRNKISRTFGDIYWKYQQFARLHDRSERIVSLYADRLTSYPHILNPMDELEPAFQSIDAMWSNYLRTDPNVYDSVPWGALSNLITLSKISFRIATSIAFELGDWQADIQKPDFTRVPQVGDMIFVWKSGDPDPGLLL